MVKELEFPAYFLTVYDIIAGMMITYSNFNGTADDIPGVNDISPTGLNDEPVFPTDLIQFHGQPLFAVIAETRGIARRDNTN